MHRCIVLIVLLACSTLACNASFFTSSTPVPSPVATNSSGGGSPPTVEIQAPASGTQAVVNLPFTVRVHAKDDIGITRVEMHESGRIVSTQPSPDPNPDFTALMQYLPTNTGTVTLEVIAYRQSVASQPVSLSIEVVGSIAQLSNPNSLDPTSGVAAGIICTVRVNISGLNLRVGPGTSYRVLTRLSVGDELVVIGRNSDSSWYQAKRGATNAGWVSAGYTTADGDCSKAPEVTPVPQ